MPLFLFATLLQFLFDLFKSLFGSQKAQFENQFPALAKKGITVEQFTQYNGFLIYATLDIMYKDTIAMTLQRFKWLKDASMAARSGAWGVIAENESMVKLADRSVNFYEYLTTRKEIGYGTPLDLSPQEMDQQDQNKFGFGVDLVQGMDQGGGIRIIGVPGIEALLGVEMEFPTRTQLGEIVAEDLLRGIVSWQANAIIDIGAAESGNRAITTVLDCKKYARMTYLQNTRWPTTMSACYWGAKDLTELRSSLTVTRKKEVLRGFFKRFFRLLRLLDANPIENFKR